MFISTFYFILNHLKCKGKKVNAFYNLCKGTMSFLISPSAEIYRINRENYRYLHPEAENPQRFVAFVPPSSGIVLAIYNTLNGLHQIRPLEMAVQMQQITTKILTSTPSTV